MNIINLQLRRDEVAMDQLASDYFAAARRLTNLPASKAELVSIRSDMGEGDDDETPYEIESGVAIIPVKGMLIPEGPRWLSYFGITTYSNIAEDIKSAEENPSVNGIILDVASYGGDSFGNYEVADVVSKAKKPICAVVSQAACSAAYLIASQADRVFVNQNSSVGSIGCLAVHVDCTAMDQKEGVKYTYIQSGNRKSEFSPHKKLSAEAESTMQAEVDRRAEMFFGYVSKGRGISVESIRSMEAATYMNGQAAIEAELADAIGNMDDAMEWVNKKAAKSIASSVPAFRPFGNESEPANNFQEESIQEMTQADEAGEQISAQATVAAPEATMDESKFEFNEATIGAITNICNVEGRPDLLGKFLAEKKSPAEVKAAILAEKAASPEINSHVSGADNSAKGMQIMQNAIDAAIRSRGMTPVVRQ